MEEETEDGDSYGSRNGSECWVGLVWREENGVGVDNINVEMQMQMLLRVCARDCETMRVSEWVFQIHRLHKSHSLTYYSPSFSFSIILVRINGG